MHEDTVLRTAVVCWLTDPGASLSTAHREWLTALLERRTALSSREREGLRGPLLAWCAAAVPCCLEVLTRQFAPRTEERATHARLRD